MADWTRRTGIAGFRPAAPDGIATRQLDPPPDVTGNPRYAKAWPAFIVTVIMGCLIAPPAEAQILDRYVPALVLGPNELSNDTVMSRPHLDYVSPGIQLGSVIFQPTVQESDGYDSNVFGHAHGPGSARAESSATLQANTDWSRNAVGMYVNVDNVETLQASQLSHTDETASVAGMLDIGRDQLRAAYTYFNLTLLPTDIEGSGLRQAAPFQLNDLRASYTTQSAQFAFIPDIDLQNYKFGNGSATGSTTGLSYLDRDVVSGGLTTRFELAPQRDVLLVVRGTDAQYRGAQPDMPRRNYTDVQVLGGFDYTANALLRYRVLAGYETRQYASSRISGASAPMVEASVVWNPNRLTTITGTLTRRIEDAIEDNIADYIYSEARLQVDLELRRNILVRAYGDVQNVDYQQNGGSQTVYGTGISATWLMNRNLQSRLSFAFADSVGTPLTTYTREVSMLQLMLRF